LDTGRRDIPLIKAFLTPLSWAYGGITDIRNALYRHGFFDVFMPYLPTISIGNLTVGGTGKTPLTEFLVRHLQHTYKIALLSRGYGRETRGVRVAGFRSTAGEIGDEPMQYFRKFRGDIPVVVAEKRREGMQRIAAAFPETSLILLDDAFQHRAVGRHVNILLSDYRRPFYDDVPFPAGNLRERRKGAARADIIIVTKCPHTLPAEEKRLITERMYKYSPGAPVFFSGIRYGTPVSFDGQARTSAFRTFIALAGTARNGPFESYARHHFPVSAGYSFRDHHRYTIEDLVSTGIPAAKDTGLLTTEKDMVKLLPLAEKLGLTSRCFYIPIETDFGEEKEVFIDTVKQVLARTASGGTAG